MASRKNGEDRVRHAPFAMIRDKGIPFRSDMFRTEMTGDDRDNLHQLRP
jgi:hypothetical protein